MKEQFIITELLDNGIGGTKQVVWQHTRTHDNRKITFWGSFDSLRNIKTIKNQDIPFILEISGAEENSKFKRKYGTDVSVNEGCSITINPMPAHQVRWLMTPENIKNVEQLLRQVSVNLED